MSRIVNKTDDGWEVLTEDGHHLQVMPEICFVADLKRGLALFPGEREAVEETLASLGRRCKAHRASSDFTENIMMASLPGNINEIEAAYMLSTTRLPRRVKMRLRKERCVQ